MIKLSSRSYDKECLDDPHIDAGTLRGTYQELRSINLYTLGYWPTMSAVGYFLSRYGRDRQLKILDIGCGDGETLRRIDDYGRRHNFSYALTGIDLSTEAIASARALTRTKIDFIHGDIFSHERDEIYDVIINSLTMHHMKDHEIISLIQWMSEKAGTGWFISDLHRNVIAYYFIKYFSRVGGFNPLICNDAPLSVARGFRRREWIDLLTRAGINLDRVKIFWYPNFRYGIRYEKSI